MAASSRGSVGQAAGRRVGTIGVAAMRLEVGRSCAGPRDPARGVVAAAWARGGTLACLPMDELVLGRWGDWARGRFRLPRGPTPWCRCHVRVAGSGVVAGY